ncbi:MAG: hypothetical protein MI861_24250 [Pirellulales bacterium]|nr:hypothetical protein [Pirellulales bacterium]
MASPAFAETVDKVDLRYRSYRDWSIHLPAEQWFAVKDGIRIGHAGEKFAVSLAGNDLRFDTDGDGELDRTITPLVDLKTNVSTTRVILSSSDENGKKFRYAVRLRKDTQGWQWAPGGAMVGTLSTAAGPLPIRIIDQNGNGRFNDYGADAMIVGATDNAMFLSKAIHVNQQLRRLDAAEDGSTLTLQKFEGPTAAVDMTTSFDARALLLSAVLLSADSQYSFDVGTALGPIEVPVGTYRVAGGLLGLGDARVDISAGKMKPLDLAAGKSVTFDWGGPARSEFQFVRVGNEVHFSPDSIWFYGKAGEQYSNWRPIGKSPEFKVLDSESGVVLEVAILPGSC